MNVIEISAIGIIVCTMVNFIFFILALFLTLTVQNWKNDINNDMKILALDKKTEAEAEHWISVKEQLPTEKELEARAESYGSDLCCICRECDECETNPCQRKIDAMHGYKDGLRHDRWHYPSKGELPKVGE